MIVKFTFMLTNNFALYGGKIIVEIIWDIIRFPLWWYSRGLMEVSQGLLNFLRNREKALALFVWVKNIFKPMYAQRDWQGILISFFMRLIQIIIRGLIMVFWIFFSLAVLCFWLVLPLLVIYEILWQIL